MSRTNRSRRIRDATTVLAIALTSALLAACGGSSPTTTADTTTAGAPSATAHSTGSDTSAVPKPGSTPSTGANTGPTSTEGTGKGANTQPTTPPAATAKTLPTGKASKQEIAATVACMQKAGVSLPNTSPGGTTGAQYQAALKKCLPKLHIHVSPPDLKTSLPTAARFRSTLVKFGECLRHSGVNIPPPNTSASGPVLELKRLDRSSPQFKAALTKCHVSP